MVQDSFLYCWTNKANGKLYIGTHKGTIDDGYVCSSRIMIEEYLNNPSEFTRSIIATGNYKDMIGLETFILKSVDAARNICFYNMHNGDGEFYNKGHSEETKRKISLSNKGKKRPDLTFRNLTNNPAKNPIAREKMKGPRPSVMGENNPMWGKNHTEKSKIKMSENRKGKGKEPKSEATKKLMSEARKQYWSKRKTS
jgi:hypothetical protein